MAYEIQQALKVIKEEIVQSRIEIKSTIEALEARILLQIETANNRIKYLEKENTSLQNRIEMLDRITRKNNILVFGLESSDKNTPAETCQKLSELLDVDLQVADLNNYYNLNKSQSVVKVEFISNLKKVEVLKQCRKLKNTGVSISQDLTIIQREENKILRSHLKKARENPITKSYIKGNKLYIEDRSYTVEDLKQNSEELELRTNNSAPSTPAPISEIKLLQKELLGEEYKNERTQQHSEAITNKTSKENNSVIFSVTPMNKSKTIQKIPDQITARRLRSGSQSGIYKY